MNKTIRIGIDLGGTKIEGIALDTQGNVLIKKRIATPKHDYHQILFAIKTLIESIESTIKNKATLGIGTPGAISPKTGLLKNSNTVCLNNKPLLEDLQTILKRKVRIANDANCFALSEAIDGSAKNFSTVFGVILGTGTGGGIVVEKHLLQGANAIGGEWGHNPLPWMTKHEWPGPSCYCGKNGCIETFCSGPALSLDHQSHSGELLQAFEIAKRAKEGVSNAKESIERYANRLARALASVINILDPDIIVLGGGLSSIKELYTEVPKHWQNFVFSDKVDTPLVPPHYGDASGVRGAAWLWPIS